MDEVTGGGPEDTGISASYGASLTSSTTTHLWTRETGGASRSWVSRWSLEPGEPLGSRVSNPTLEQCRMESRHRIAQVLSVRYLREDLSHPLLLAGPAALVHPREQETKLLRMDHMKCCYHSAHCYQNFREKLNKYWCCFSVSITFSYVFAEYRVSNVALSSLGAILSLWWVQIKRRQI